LAAILAGGFGKRLRPFTEEFPKPMISIGGRTLLEYQIEWLRSFGFSEVVLLVGYKKEKIIEHFGSGSRYGVKITYVVEDEPLGTGGAVKNAEHILSKEDVFLVLNGDILTNLNPLLLVEKVNSSRLLGVIATIPLPSPYGILELEGGDCKGVCREATTTRLLDQRRSLRVKTRGTQILPRERRLGENSIPSNGP
jgi:Nucleoside-diphosphate-sugar pyrophosphorylase involved in lipopolysaccharide biosynthesis/translation initiation factor 2B, gamma/epsilon subunits (eIF-2Bgamma/eIF-2Bepsilon)